eukprot:COSAG02_NODE_6637_length_3445_cov_15.508747_3_plen_815_part_00
MPLLLLCCCSRQRGAAAGAPTSRAALTPTDGLEIALRAAGVAGLEKRVVFYMTGSFCPVHVQHLQAVQAAAEDVQRRSGGSARAVGAFIAPAHDDHVSEEYSAAGCSSWFLPSECRIQLVQLAIGHGASDASMAVDCWAARQPKHVPAGAAQADLQAYLDGWCADLQLPSVSVVRLLGSDDTESIESQPLLCLERDGMPRTAMLVDGQSTVPAPSGGRLTSADVRAAFHSQGGADGMMHPAVKAQLHEWWRAPRVLAFPLPPSFRSELAARFESPLSSVTELQSRLELDKPICSALESSPHFCTETYRNIVSEAAKLCLLTEPIPLQSAGTDDTLTLPRYIARALLAAMLLGMPPLPGSEGEDMEGMLKPRDCRDLWTAKTPDSIRALMAALAYFDPNSRNSPAPGGTGVADAISLRRCVLAKEVDFAARSPRPMQPVSLLQTSESEARHCPPAVVATCRVGCFACGGSDAEVAIDCYADVALRPELLVGALFCPALRRDEAMVASNTMHVSLDGATDGQHGHHTGLLSIPTQALVLIDFAGVEPLRAATGSPSSTTAVTAEGWLARVRRDLEKCYCAFAAGAQAARSSQVRSAMAAPLASFSGDTSPTGAADAVDLLMVEMVMQWLAASEAGCALDLQLPRPFSAAVAVDYLALAEQFHNLVREMVAIEPATVSPTVGWVWARLQEFVKQRLDALSSGSTEDGVCSFLAVLRSALEDGAAFPAGTAPSVRRLAFTYAGTFSLMICGFIFCALAGPSCRSCFGEGRCGSDCGRYSCCRGRRRCWCICGRRKALEASWWRSNRTCWWWSSAISVQ